MANSEGVAGVTKIKFDFEFTYSKDGDEDIGDTIVLNAPNFQQSEIHYRMTSFVTKGIFSAMPQLEKAAGISDDDKSDDKNDSDEEQNYMLIMALGMDDKQFVEFTKYVKQILTNNPDLARIDNEQIGITDLLWQQIAENGGPQAVDRVLSAFIHFFMAALNSPKKAA